MYDIAIRGNALVVEKTDKGRYTYDEVKIVLLDYISGKYVKAAEAVEGDGVLETMYW